MSAASDPDTELTKVSLSVLGGVARAEIPVRRSMFSFFQRWRHAAPQPALFPVPWMRAHVFAAEEDSGSIDVFLSLVNMAPDPVRVEQLLLERIAVSGPELNVTAPLFRPPDEPVPAHKIATLHFRVPLDAPAIRLILRVTQKASNLRSTPRLDLILSGRIELSVGKERLRVPFQVGCLPELAFQVPAAAQD